MEIHAEPVLSAVNDDGGLPAFSCAVASCIAMLCNADVNRAHLQTTGIQQRPNQLKSMLLYRVENVTFPKCVSRYFRQ